MELMIDCAPGIGCRDLWSSMGCYMRRKLALVRG